VPSDLQWIAERTLATLPETLKKKDFSKLNIGAVFLACLPGIKTAAYGKYCGNIPQSRQIRTQCIVENRKYANFMEQVHIDLRDMKDQHMGDIDTMMDEPVMRLR